MGAMAKAIDNIPLAGGDEWTVDEAFQYLTRAKRKPSDEAIYELTQSLLAGKLRACVSHFVDGTLKTSGMVAATYWRNLALNVVEGRAVVAPLYFGLDPGSYRYTVSASDVRELWPTEKLSTKELLDKETQRREALGERWRSITKLSRSMQQEPNLQHLDPRTIEKRDWDLFSRLSNK
jgi:hypothetical protein